eukprot:Rhum_TRINITY_DN2211_c0_g1::Rhum_TRINITY_DN2211_c0_g1_i1::g.6494::m.6494
MQLCLLLAKHILFGGGRGGDGADGGTLVVEGGGLGEVRVGCVVVVVGGGGGIFFTFCFFLLPGGRLANLARGGSGPLDGLLRRRLLGRDGGRLRPAVGAGGRRALLQRLARTGALRRLAGRARRLAALGGIPLELLLLALLLLRHVRRLAQLQAAALVVHARHDVHQVVLHANRLRLRLQRVLLPLVLREGLVLVVRDDDLLHTRVRLLVEHLVRHLVDDVRVEHPLLALLRDGLLRAAHALVLLNERLAHQLEAVRQHLRGLRRADLLRLVRLLLPRLELRAALLQLVHRVVVLLAVDTVRLQVEDQLLQVLVLGLVRVDGELRQQVLPQLVAAGLDGRNLLLEVRDLLLQLRKLVAERLLLVGHHLVGVAARVGEDLLRRRDVLVQLLDLRVEHGRLLRHQPVQALLLVHAAQVLLVVRAQGVGEQLLLAGRLLLHEPADALGHVHLPDAVLLGLLHVLHEQLLLLVLLLAPVVVHQLDVVVREHRLARLLQHALRDLLRLLQLVHAERPAHALVVVDGHEAVLAVGVHGVGDLGALLLALHLVGVGDELAVVHNLHALLRGAEERLGELQLPLVLLRDVRVAPQPPQVDAHEAVLARHHHRLRKADAPLAGVLHLQPHEHLREVALLQLDAEGAAELLHDAGAALAVEVLQLLVQSLLLVDEVGVVDHLAALGLDRLDQVLLLRREGLRVVPVLLVRRTVRLRVQQLHHAVGQVPRDAAVGRTLHRAHVVHERAAVLRQLAGQPLVVPVLAGRCAPHADHTVDAAAPHHVVGDDEAELRALGLADGAALLRREQRRDRGARGRAPHLEKTVRRGGEQVLLVGSEGADGAPAAVAGQDREAVLAALLALRLVDVAAADGAVVASRVQAAAEASHLVPLQVRHAAHSVLVHGEHLRVVELRAVGVPLPDVDLPVPAARVDLVAAVDAHARHDLHARHGARVLAHLAVHLELRLAAAVHSLHRQPVRAVSAHRRLHGARVVRGLAVDVADDHALRQARLVRRRPDLQAGHDVLPRLEGDGHLGGHDQDLVSHLAVDADVSVGETGVHLVVVVQQGRHEHTLLALDRARRLAGGRLPDGQRAVLLGRPHAQLVEGLAAVEHLQAADLAGELTLVDDADLARLDELVRGTLDPGIVHHLGIGDLGKVSHLAFLLAQ